MKRVSFVRDHKTYYNIMFIGEYMKDNLVIILHTHVEGNTCYGATITRTAKSRKEAAKIVKELRRDYNW